MRYTCDDHCVECASFLNELQLSGPRMQWLTVHYCGYSSQARPGLGSQFRHTLPPYTLTDQPPLNLCALLSAKCTSPTHPCRSGPCLPALWTQGCALGCHQVRAQPVHRARLPVCPVWSAQSSAADCGVQGVPNLHQCETYHL